MTIRLTFIASTIKLSRALLQADSRFLVRPQSYEIDVLQLLAPRVRQSGRELHFQACESDAEVATVPASGTPSRSLLSRLKIGQKRSNLG